MSAPGTYNLSCVLLIAGPPSGLDRTAKARPTEARDWSGFSWTCWLTADEISSKSPWGVSAQAPPLAAPLPVIALSVRIGERPGWTDPAGV